MKRTGKQTIGGAGFHVEVEGEGPPLILLHGAYCNSSVWDDHIRLLSRSFTVIRYDQRGHGRSDGVTGLFSHHLDLKAIFDHFGLSRAPLIASCAGGGIAIDFALAYPQHVEQLILTAPSLGGMRIPLRAMWESFSDIRRVKRQGIERAGGLFVRSKYWSHAVPRESLQRARFKQMYLDNGVHYGGRLGMHRPLFPRAYKRLGEIRCPVLIVEAGRDSAFNKKVCRYLRREIPHARLVVMESSGHHPHLEQPLEFAAIAMSALKERMESS
ncbi:alpha/beta hydrolase [Saccharibacillus sp. CPCC 101409]|uniref:alpha/beta fold hydrolase n=1 Tax=Saccharibacillus sp. CPCC 101409 TaxID=3058041 RepID=UPI0026711CFC|nr:alpha/beta hydrolase [Saccharibacillus sp. CPCC 101409]MDO3410378.1 alpha/beta hydrolase [Saccharibacillus sp. CPCC 101409]